MAKPKKPAPTAKGDEANDVILKYLKKQNRPYSAVDVFNNLGGQVGKSNVLKALTALAEEKQIHAKLNGKQWVYVAKQDDLQVPSKEDLDAMDSKIAKLKDELAALKEETREAQAVLNGLTNSLTNEQIEQRLRELKEENSKLEERLSSLRSRSTRQQLSAEDRKRIDKNLEAMQKEWRKRKRMFNDMWAAVTENIQGSLAEFRETVGVETDEAAGLDINADLLKGLV
ncbi:uncharacterized protein SPPG_01179 [Spizellomyces punctatus DAOM BR117]|uniref:Homologous-pairing protein 2 homolog n=1 Tax=Spizellomyces punctatus (strain DAOM BR117) TaxID=645134 RepID=A0A0L0HRM1_SPIPD|nr:uncharacterized protein SPPG_01179 [Spizellomyces punctatus DAOM BR117]KND03717.1 hypothetical protein SPPG_01179 [Spizellomyces punctatus DAOM BR117]|eukprot:XP_016611756.1 hypothetical protein SPPG_01179 [Spizellomyces punctatus DAOM BR117]